MNSFHTFQIEKTITKGIGHSVTVSLDEDATLSDVIEAFEGFLYAVGYRLPDGATIGYEYEDKPCLPKDKGDCGMTAAGYTKYRLVGSDKVIITHSPLMCEGQYCCIHNHSDHHMREWPQNWRQDSGMMERICHHGIGHPDPDDPKAKNSIDSVHGCDGCCNPDKH